MNNSGLMDTSAVNGCWHVNRWCSGSLTVHSPDLHLPVVGSGYDEGHAGVKGRPVDPSVVTLDTETQTSSHTSTNRHPAPVTA